LTFLRNIDFAILGTITFNDSPDWWVGKTFNYAFQSASLFWRFGGTNVRIHGAGRGTIDGRGQSYWNRIPANSAVLRPILLGFDGLKQSSITDLNYINPPGWFHFLANSTDVLFSDLTMVVNQLNASAPAKVRSYTNMSMHVRLIIRQAAKRILL
jgi:galacturan 1,4-alpha-galacturonidase